MCLIQEDLGVLDLVVFFTWSINTCR